MCNTVTQHLYSFPNDHHKSTNHKALIAHTGLCSRMDTLFTLFGLPQSTSNFPFMGTPHLHSVWAWFPSLVFTPPPPQIFLLWKEHRCSGSDLLHLTLGHCLSILKYWIIGFLTLEFWEILICSWYKSFVENVICQYFLPVHRLSFPSLNSVFYRELKFLVLMNFNLSVF